MRQGSWTWSPIGFSFAQSVNGASFQRVSGLSTVSGVGSPPLPALSEGSARYRNVLASNLTQLLDLPPPSLSIAATGGQFAGGQSIHSGLTPSAAKRPLP